MIPCYVVCFMYESTQLNGTSILPKPPHPPPLVVGVQQLKRTGTSLSSTNSRTQQLKGLAQVYFEKKYQSLLNRKHKNRHRVNSHYQHKNNANKLAAPNIQHFNDKPSGYNDFKRETTHCTFRKKVPVNDVTYILAHNLAKRLAKNEDVTLHFHHNTAINNIQGP